MLRYGLIFFLAVIIVISLQFGQLAQAERQCDDNDKSYTLAELILLFPVSFLDDNKCSRDLDDVSDTTNIVLQFVSLVQRALAAASQTVLGSLASVGHALYYPLCTVEGLSCVLWISNYASFIETIDPSEYISYYLSYIWNLDPAGSIVHVLTVYTLSLLPTCIPITEQIANILPNDVIATTMDHVYRTCTDLLESPVWAVRVMAVILLAVSLIISLYKKRRNKCYRKQLQSLKNVSEHYQMCEIFDDDKCNCGGKMLMSDPGTVKDIPLHYGMCESFDRLPCNCGGIVKNESITESKNYDDALLYTWEEVDTLSDTKQSTGECADISRDDLINTVSSEEQILDELEHFQESFETGITNDECDTGIYHDINVANLPQDSENLHDAEVDGQSRAFEEMIKNHYQMCECFDFQPCNCGGRSLCSSEVTDCCNDDLETKEIIQCKEEEIFQISPQEDELTDRSPQYLEDSDPIPNIVYFDCEINVTDESLCYDKATTDATKAGNVTRDDSDEVMNDYTDDISESDIGAPDCNSSFREESQYVTANKSNTFEDTFAGGDVVLSLSTLTRRSPYIEQGLEDLVTDDSFVDAETSFLDISSIDNSISYAAGDGVFEFAVMFIAQTAWRLVHSLWRRKIFTRSMQDLTVEETSPGLYLIRQKNKLKSYLTGHHRNNSASVEDDDGYHGDQELDVSETGVDNGKDSNHENSFLTIFCDGNNNAKELKKGTDTKNQSANENVQQKNESENVHESFRKQHIEEGSSGNIEKEYNDNNKDSKPGSRKQSKFNALLEQAGQFNCNVWELCDDKSETLYDDRSRLLTWAWSSLGEDV